MKKIVFSENMTSIIKLKTSPKQKVWKGLHESRVCSCERSFQRLKDITHFNSPRNRLILSNQLSKRGHN